MEIRPVDFYLVIPDIHVNAKRIQVYKIQSKNTGEIVKQVPSEEEIARIEALETLKNKVKLRVPSK